MLTIIFIIILSLFFITNIMLQGIFLIHKLQQMSYSNIKFIKWLEGNSYRKIFISNIFELFIPLTIILAFYYLQNDIKIYKYIAGSIIILTFIWKIIYPFVAGLIGPKAIVKKKLVYTQRVIRLLIIEFITTLLILLFILRVIAYPLSDFTLNSWAFFQLNAFILFISVISPIILLISNIFAIPIEKLIHSYYYNKAKNKIRKSKIISIGVTGSFGKTSTKFFLAKVLSENYKTLTTPSSYNTPMGLSKVINNNNLDDYEYFVAEMGADHKNDIRVLANLVKPKYGIITAVGIQHLETFGTPMNILNTKLQLFEALDQSGWGIYNYDSPMLRDGVASRTFNCKLYSYSIDENNREKVTIFGSNINHSKDGLSFDAIFNSEFGGDILKIKAKILGRHNVLNLLAVILASRLLGLSNEKILDGISKIESVEHRLQLIDNGNGILVLDDSFNSNYNGAIEAINVLSEIGKDHKRIVVTPGFVEMGSEEERYNKMLGEYMASKISHCILVGDRKTMSIKEGLLNSGFVYEKIFTVKNLSEAQTILSGLLTKGDVVLFENDLPDIYDEDL